MSAVVDIVAKVLEVPVGDLDDDTGRGDLAAWTSLRHLQLVAAVEDAFGLRLTSSEIRGLRTVADLRALVDARGVGTS